MKKKAAPQSIALPSWAHVTPARRQHIARVVTLLTEWASALRVSPDETSRWTSAGVLHDALRDAPEHMLRALTGDGTTPAELLHGPAAAVRAEQDGERRGDVLEAVRFHTVGNAKWNRTGRALYLADFLEPGRKFLGARRTRLAAKVPKDFDGAFRDVVRARIELALQEGGKLFPETVALWNALR